MVIRIRGAAYGGPAAEVVGIVNGQPSAARGCLPRMPQRVERESPICFFAKYVSAEARERLRGCLGCSCLRVQREGEEQAGLSGLKSRSAKSLYERLRN